jgi:hypothetical protein
MNINQLNKEIATIEARIEKTRQKIASANSGPQVTVEEQQPKPVSQILGKFLLVYLNVLLHFTLR